MAARKHTVVDQQYANKAVDHSLSERDRRVGGALTTEKDSRKGLSINYVTLFLIPQWVHVCVNDERVRQNQLICPIFVSRPNPDFLLYRWPNFDYTVLNIGTVELG
jgi:hypothetical protein